jgi:hypothetical protein
MVSPTSASASAQFLPTSIGEPGAELEVALADDLGALSSSVPTHPASPKFHRRIQSAKSSFCCSCLPLCAGCAIDLCCALSVCSSGRPALAAQDDVTTQNATSGYNGVFITGPASNPLSFLNGAAGRTTGNPAPYDFHDFAPATYLDEKLPNWIDVQAEERFRYEAYDNSTASSWRQ